MELKFYVSLKELARGGQACEITYDRPIRERYVKVLSDTTAYAHRGCNSVYFCDTLLAEELRSEPRSSVYDWVTEEKEPSIGLLDDALKKAKELGIIREVAA